MMRRPDKVLLLAYGCALTFNLPYSVTGGSVRASDIVGLLIVFYALKRCAHIRIERGGMWALLASAVLFACWAGAASWGYQTEGFTISLRLGLGVVTALAVFQTDCFRAPEKPFLLGLALGSIPAVCLSLQQFYSPSGALFIAPDAQLTWVGERYRATGLWDHPNANMAVTMLGGAAALQLAMSNARKARLWIAVFVFIAVGTFVATAARSGLIVSGVLVCGYLLRAKENRERFFVASATILTGLVVVALAAEPLIERIVGYRANVPLWSNLGQRAETIWHSLVAIATHPLGMGVNGHRNYLTSSFGFAASHNGFLYGLMVFGWAYGLLAYALIRFVIRFRLRPLGLVAVAIVIFHLFEDVPQLASYAAMIPIFMTSGARGRKEHAALGGSPNALPAERPTRLAVADSPLTTPAGIVLPISKGE